MIKKLYFLITLVAITLAIVFSANAKSLQKGILVVTCDDGHWTQWEYLAPIMQQYGIVGTCYPVTEWIKTDNNYMWVEQLQALKVRGWEIGNHTQNHIPVIDEASAQDVILAKQDLLEWGLGPVLAFAPPFGEFDAQTVNLIKGQGYTSLRQAWTEDSDVNSPDTFNPMTLNVISLKSATDLANVIAWLDKLAAQKVAGIVVIHEVDVANDTDSITSATATQIFTHAAQLIVQGKLEAMTVSQMVRRLRPADISAAVKLLLLD